MKKTTKVEDFLLQHEDPAKGYKQFTIDWIEEARDEIVEFNEKPYMTEGDFLHALNYKADTVLGVMRDDLDDRAFFCELIRLLSKMAKASDTKTRRSRMVSLAGLN